MSYSYPDFQSCLIVCRMKKLVVLIHLFDVFNLFFSPEAQAGTMTQGAVFGFAVFMETAIAMVLLSRVLKYGVNRWANIIAGIIHTALVSWSLSVGTQLPFYIFFASIEIACTLFIVWYAWRWRKQEA